jgi:simple sugar transport system permease protein
MLNWIAANVVTMLFDKESGPFKFLLDPSGTKNLAYVFKTTHNGVATSKFGLNYIFEGSQVNGGIIIAIIIAVIIYIMLNKTTFGYRLKACGSNKHAAKYAGINEKVSIIISMAISGGLAAAGASLYYLSGNTEFAWETYQSLPAQGFNGIPVALLAFNNPIGVVFSASFVSLLDVNGMQLKYMTPYNEYITSIITAVIVYFSAFSLLFKQILEGKIKINIKNIFQSNHKKTIEEKEKTK